MKEENELYHKSENEKKRSYFNQRCNISPINK